jgi:hypothetical protein
MLSKKTFDAVSESRKWREAASRKLDAMNKSERVKYLRSIAETFRTEMRPRRRAENASRTA